MFLKLAILAVALGLDVWAVSAAVGVARPDPSHSLRLALLFATAEIAMMLGGYAVGQGVGHLLGQFAAYVGFALLALIGLLMMFQADAPRRLSLAGGAGIALTALSISLDSLGVGFALPAAGVSMPALVATVAVSTVSSTFMGLALGARLGKRYGSVTEVIAGALLVILAVVFALERWHGGRL
ncbi:MAG TPA: manganese efflux pump [Candidatus Binataceae bacterium]|nr:manganese efflux pump [Candidatus Binataceae bacterium]